MNSSTIAERLAFVRMVAAYHARLSAKLFAAPFLPAWNGGTSGSVTPAPRRSPRVTVLITSANQRGPLEVTLRTLRATAGYENYEVWVADHGSTDGTVEFLDRLVQEGWPLRVIQHGERRPQHEWYDFMLRNAQTPYWVGLHEDLIFFAKGWLADLIAFMETHPDIDLLGGEEFPPQPGYVEPVSQAVVDLEESLSTWVFCVRTALRERIESSFAYHDEWDEERQRKLLYDQGGKLIADLKSAGFGFASMPPWFTWKFHHVGNLSWTFDHAARGVWHAFKRYQIRDARRRARRLHRKDHGRRILKWMPAVTNMGA
jgi:glycosyltransferase involved in cell wall biosynthesis